jgi:glutamate synthase domain-containing protein 2/glutamate synthase domain-containing protein 1/glutamate synthase domain-containing protein 3
MEDHQRTGQIPPAAGLYDPASEHDACGIGIIADLRGKSSQSIVADALEALRNLEHRGAVGGDRKTGDGAGLLCGIPDRFFREAMGLRAEDFPQPAGTKAADGLPYAIGMFFLPKAPSAFAAARTIIEKAAEASKLEVLDWRNVPTRPQVLGDKASASMPRICQVAFASRGSGGSLQAGEAFELGLYFARRRMERLAKEAGFTIDDFYVASLSSRTIVYKGMFVASQFASFYPDLSHELFGSSFAIVHQRYSTNTFPSWPLAQPFRMISHNGEINTLRKNVGAMRARQATMSSPVFGDAMADLIPVVEEAGSDSAMFDNVFEMLLRAGRPLEQVFMMMIPEPLGHDYGISRDRAAFYEFHAALMESWDGPAAMTFTDGLKVGASLDRNGLRPFRYSITRDGRFVGASEAGVLVRGDEADIVEKGMLKPGRMLVIDLAKGRLIKDREIKARICRAQPYRRWIEKNRIELRGLFSAGEAALAQPDTGRLAEYFGYDEETDKALRPMALAGQEAVAAMGSRKPPAALTRGPVPLYSYFRQRFAQVTNPPIDPYRERLVMSLESYIGRERNLLEATPAHCRQLKLLHPLLSNTDLRRLRESPLADFRVATVSLLFDVPAAAGSHGGLLEGAIERVCAEAERRIDEGCSLIILSDRGVDERRAAVPALLATSAVHGRLIAARKRHMAGLVVETGEAREIHHIAVLLGFGASGVNPWMVFERMPALLEAVGKATAPGAGAASGKPAPSPEDASDNYTEAVKRGLLKILSKLGISTISSYRGARLFEIAGLSQELCARYFGGIESRLGGIGLAEIEEDALAAHARAFGSAGEARAARPRREAPWTPALAAKLTAACRGRDAAAWRAYVDAVEDPSRPRFALRDLFDFKPARAIPLEEVESVEAIRSRFSVAAMSCGAISPEAHEALAAGANLSGAWSNSGEGGEDEERRGYADRGLDSRSASRQIASGRFGVTASYAADVLELQIKVAQGAKPGEGGQLPGAKVDAYIAKLRHSSPGRTLISPPPHHDIYSIEDLAQLIHDLRCVNPEARIAVKLAAQSGIGAVAAGVAKAGADCVVVSSGDGGTGAAPQSSLDYTGGSWEEALPEIRQVLAMNGLDANIVVQVDGRLRTARDVVIAAILGAREFAFGTAAMMAMGCVACGQCNLDRCPVGIATQDKALRGKFAGKPEDLAAFLTFMAEDVRALLASLGAKSLDELGGAWELLDFAGKAETPREKLLRFEKIAEALEISRRYPIDEEGDTDGSGPPALPLPAAGLRNFKKAKPFAMPDIDAAILERFVASGEAARLSADFTIRNADRSIGAALSGALTRLGAKPAPGAIDIRFTGSAGQSFGAFLAEGVSFTLSGQANDYLGKSLSGGRIVVRPPVESRILPEMNAIAGNVCLFGATGGEVFLGGQAGERFCVRNSGATAVVEGTGDHACEYMTGGCVVVLGRTGANFGAGITGGLAYVLDEDQLLDTRCNSEDVDLESCSAPEDVAALRRLIERHYEFTGSHRAKDILSEWENYRPLFVKVTPRA